MKIVQKAVAIFATTALLLSCTQQEPAFDRHDSEADALTSSRSAIRSVDEAAEIASRAIGMLPGGKIRSSNRTFSKNDVKVAYSHSSRNASSDTLMYVFNFDNGEGFAAVAANRAVPEGLIAVTEMGSYDPDRTPDNPGLALYMDAAENHLRGLKDSIPIFVDSTKIKVDPEYPGLAKYEIRRDTTYEEAINPNFNLRWGQRYPEGMLFPNGIAGCTNTAALMAMSYLEAPKQMNLTFYSSPQTINIDWQVLKEHHESYRYYYMLQEDGCSNATHTTISQICRELGERNHSNWNEFGSTETYSRQYLKSTLEGFGLHPSEFYQGNSSGLLTTLKNGGVTIMLGGELINENGKETESRHAFIMDGIYYLDIHVGEYMKEYGKPWVCINDHGTQKYRYHHINWGWYGDGNGFFNAGVFDASKPYKYDDEDKPASGNFSVNFYYINVFK